MTATQPICTGSGPQPTMTSVKDAVIMNASPTCVMNAVSVSVLIGHTVTLGDLL